MGIESPKMEVVFFYGEILIKEIEAKWLTKNLVTEFE
jgi:hypothetical protein